MQQPDAPSAIQTMTGRDSFHVRRLQSIVSELSKARTIDVISHDLHRRVDQSGLLSDIVEDANHVLSLAERYAVALHEIANYNELDKAEIQAIAQKALGVPKSSQAQGTLNI